MHICIVAYIDGPAFRPVQSQCTLEDHIVQNGSTLNGKQFLAIVQFLRRTDVSPGVWIFTSGQKSWRREEEKESIWMLIADSDDDVTFHLNSFCVKLSLNYSELNCISVFHADQCYCNVPWEGFSFGRCLEHIFGYSELEHTLKFTVYMVNTPDTSIAKRYSPGTNVFQFRQ